MCISDVYNYNGTPREVFQTLYEPHTEKFLPSYAIDGEINRDVNHFFYHSEGPYPGGGNFGDWFQVQSP